MSTCFQQKIKEPQAQPSPRPKLRLACYRSHDSLHEPYSAQKVRGLEKISSNLSPLRRQSARRDSASREDAMPCPYLKCPLAQSRLTEKLRSTKHKPT